MNTPFRLPPGGEHLSYTANFQHPVPHHGISSPDTRASLSKTQLAPPRTISHQPNLSNGTATLNFRHKTQHHSLCQANPGPCTPTSEALPTAAPGASATTPPCPNGVEEMVGSIQSGQMPTMIDTPILLPGPGLKAVVGTALLRLKVGTTTFEASTWTCRARGAIAGWVASWVAAMVVDTLVMVGSTISFAVLFWLSTRPVG